MIVTTTTTRTITLNSVWNLGNSEEWKLEVNLEE
jgi:hypothetical protein